MKIESLKPLLLGNFQTIGLIKFRYEPNPSEILRKKEVPVPNH
jgi:hypothetical protein